MISKAVCAQEVKLLKSQLADAEEQNEARVQQEQRTGEGQIADAAAAAEVARKAQAVVQSMVCQLNGEVEDLTGSQDRLRAEMADVCASRDALQVFDCALDISLKYKPLQSNILCCQGDGYCCRVSSEVPWDELEFDLGFACMDIAMRLAGTPYSS